MHRYAYHVDCHFHYCLSYLYSIRYTTYTIHCVIVTKLTSVFLKNILQIWIDSCIEELFLHNIIYAMEIIIILFIRVYMSLFKLIIY